MDAYAYGLRGEGRPKGGKAKVRKDGFATRNLKRNRILPRRILPPEACSWQLRWTYFVWTRAKMTSKVADFVWVADPEDVWIEGEVVATENDDKLVCKTAKGEKKVFASKVKLKNNPAEDSWNNLAVLTHLDEPNVLHSLRVRFMKDQIYTWTGPILLAVNPWRKLPGMYDLAGNSSVGTEPDPIPHVFSVAQKAYRNLASTGHSQSVLVSGESGSGKTENSKYVIQYLATVGNQNVEGLTTKSTTQQQVLQTNPILEAFGNASTLRNDNSSRFGKFIILQFDDQNGSHPQISGATIQTYLLERTRVAQVTHMERNYHIFHQLYEAVHAADQARTPKLPVDLQFDGEVKFEILGVANPTQDKRQADVENFSIVQKALQSIGVSDDEWCEIIRSLAGLMYLGNCQFSSDTSDSGSSDVDTAVLDNFGTLQTSAGLLQIEAEALARSLLERHVKAGEESVTVIQSRNQAIMSRDALLKAVYARLFAWLMKRINGSLASHTCSRESQGCGLMQGRHQIGILDIFGFEFYDVNSFEQLTINFANESLQMQFNKFVFQNEQEEYEREQIPWSHVTFIDNQPCVELIAGHPNGILSCLDEECRVPGGSDGRFAQKVRLMHNKHLEAPRTAPNLFTVKHYAGPVSYSCAGLLEKNRDSIHPHLVDLMQGSASPVLCQLFQLEVRAAPQKEPRHNIKGSASLESIGGEFKRQLAWLTQAIERTQLHYIRCINSNRQKAPRVFDCSSASHQLRCGGVIEAVRVTRAGFPARFSHEDFCAQFWNLRPKGLAVRQAFESSDCKARTRAILLGQDMHAGVDFQVGTTKVFLREGRVQKLQVSLSEQAVQAAVLLQTVLRMRAAKLCVRNRRAGMAVLQAAMKRAAAAQRLRRHLQTAVLQASVRRVEPLKRRMEMRAAAAKLQRWLMAGRVRQREVGGGRGEAHALCGIEGGSQVGVRGWEEEIGTPDLSGSADEAAGQVGGCSQCKDWGEKVEEIEQELERLHVMVQASWAEQAELACRLEHKECEVHAERERAGRAEEGEQEAERALLRVRREKEEVQTANEELVELVASLQRERAALQRKNEELAKTEREHRAREDKYRVQIAELTRQRARLTRLCTSTGPTRNSLNSSHAGLEASVDKDPPAAIDQSEPGIAGVDMPQERVEKRAVNQTQGSAITARALSPPTGVASPAIQKIVHADADCETPRGLSTPREVNRGGLHSERRARAREERTTPQASPGFMLQACSRLRASMSPTAATPIRAQAEASSPHVVDAPSPEEEQAPAEHIPRSAAEVGGSRDGAASAAEAESGGRNLQAQTEAAAEGSVGSERDASSPSVATTKGGACASASKKTARAGRQPKARTPASSKTDGARRAAHVLTESPINSPTARNAISKRGGAASKAAPRSSPKHAKGSVAASPGRTGTPSARSPASDRAIAAASVVMKSRRQLPR